MEGGVNCYSVDVVEPKESDYLGMLYQIQKKYSVWSKWEYGHAWNIKIKM